MDRSAFNWFIIYSLLVTTALSQNLEQFQYWGYDYNKELYLSVAASLSSLQNTEAPVPSNHNISGWTFKIDMKNVKFARGEMRYSLQYKLLGDVFTIADKAFKEDSRNVLRSVGSSVTNGLLGWHNFVFNLNEASPHSLALGFHHNDYFVASTYESDTNVGGRISHEPQGFYWSAGPSITYNYRPLNFLFLEFNGQYSFTYWRSNSISWAQDDNDYPLPHFLNLSAELMTSYGFFLGLDHTALLNRGNLPNRTRRTDLLIGFRFML